MVNINRMRDHVPGYREHLFAEVDRAIREWDGRYIVLPPTPKAEPRRKTRLERKALSQVKRRWCETVKDGTFDRFILAETCFAFRVEPHDIGVGERGRRQDGSPDETAAAGA